MSLADKQGRFAEMVAQLIMFATSFRREDGHPQYRVRFGDAYRSPQVEYGHPRSLHRSRLAVDLILDVWNGQEWVYQRDTADYTTLGEYWESMGGSWGGRFNDGNHFSLAHGGVR